MRPPPFDPVTTRLEEPSWVFAIIETSRDPNKTSESRYTNRGFFKVVSDANCQATTLLEDYASLMGFHLKDDTYQHGTNGHGGMWWEMEFVDARIILMEVEKWF